MDLKVIDLSKVDLYRVTCSRTVSGLIESAQFEKAYHYDRYLLGDTIPSPAKLFHLPDNVNIYCPISKVPKGIAKGSKFKFVSDPSEADIVAIDTTHDFNSYGLGVYILIYSKKSKILCQTEELFYGNSRFISDANLHFDVDDFKVLYEGPVRGFHGNDIQYILKAAKYGCSIMDYKLLQKAYIENLDELDEVTLKSIFKMAACSDAQTKELGLKLLLHYNPSKYPLTIGFILNARNDDIRMIKSHSSYVNFYADYVLHGQPHIYKNATKLARVKWYHNRSTDSTPEDWAMLDWAEKEGLELSAY